MTLEHSPSGSLYEESILTIDENGEEVRIPISEISELRQDPYHWGDAMTVTYDKGDNDE